MNNAREFISGSAFGAYDAILHIVLKVESARKKAGTWKEGDPLVFFGKKTTLAKRTGTSEDTVTRNVKRLVQDGWLIPKVDHQLRDRVTGNFTTYQYRVVMVEEWLLTHVPTKTKRPKNRNILKVNVRKKVGAALAAMGHSPEVVTRIIDVATRVRFTAPQNTCVTAPQDSSTAAPQNTCPAAPKEPSTAAPKEPSTRVVGSMVVGSGAVNPPTHTNGRENLNLNTFAQVSKYLKMEMLTSQWKRGEMEQVNILIAKHGGEKFIAAQLLYWREQDPTFFARLTFRWTGLLNSFEGILNKVTPEFLSELAEERWKNENPEEYQRRLQASIDYQIAEDKARAAAIAQAAEAERVRKHGSVCEEVNLEDFMADE